MFFQHHTDLPSNNEQIVVVHQHFLLMALMASKLAMHGSSVGTPLKYIPEQVKYPLH